MCGIAGFVGKPLDKARVDFVHAQMDRRGPDHKGFAIANMGESKVHLLHSRLSIIDLDPRANQPFHFNHLHLIFNGEIYNYIELRQELKSLGISFQTDSDTEVLIKAYSHWGNGTFAKFEGMWAIAIYDDRKQKLILCRDRFAEKPFYYYATETSLAFGSEIKFIEGLRGERLRPNISQALRYMVNGHKSLYKTSEQFYEGLKEVPNAHYLEIDEQLDVTSHAYWKPEHNPVDMSEAEAIERIQQALIRSVDLRMRADVPLAFCLSGGVDSSAMASIAVKSLNRDVQTFSIIDKDPRYDELDNIQATVDDLGCKNQQIELSPDFDYLSQLEKLVGYHDGPVATISYLVHSRLIGAMAEQGYKVSISGTGADELFTGYYDHFLLQMANLDEQALQDRVRQWHAHPAKAVRNPFLQDPYRFVNDPSFRDHIYLNNDAFRSFLKVDFNEGFQEHAHTSDLLRNRMMNELFHEVVRVILHEDDLNSMYYSIENRSPFLDTQLFETAQRIPTHLLIQKGYNKYLLRESLKGILNDKVRLSREKKGFNASLNSVINFENKTHREMILDQSDVYNIVDRDKIENLMKQTEFSNSYKKFFFSFLNVKMWLDGQT